MKQTITTPEQLRLILQSARKRLGLTQSEMAVLLDLSQASLSRLELNPKNMKVMQLLTLCKRLGLQLVIGDQVTPSPVAKPSPDDRADW